MEQLAQIVPFLIGPFQRLTPFRHADFIEVTFLYSQTFFLIWPFLTYEKVLGWIDSVTQKRPTVGEKGKKLKHAL